MLNKIFQIEDLAVSLEKRGDKKVVLCHGEFDLLHLGHIRYFEEAKSYGDILVVTVTPDVFVNKGPHRPVFNENYRAETIAALGIVDYVAVNKWDVAVETIRLLKPDYYVKGSDYKNAEDDLTGNIVHEENAVKGVGGEIKFTSDITFSSSQLLNANGNLFNEDQQKFIRLLRSKYSYDDIKNRIEGFKDLKILLIGEVIIDDYVTCTTLGKAGKDPILTLQKLASDTFAGGVLAIGNHLADFCNEVQILTYLGYGYHKFCHGALKSNVKLDYVIKSNSPTIAKRRYIDDEKGSKIIGVYEINDDPLSEDENREYCQKLSNQISQFDLVIVADYGHGLISSEAIKILENKSKYLAVNTQLNSANIGFHTISKYKKASYVCMHEGELRHDFRSKNRDINQLATTLYNRIKSDVITITQGAKGALTYNEKDGFHFCPAFARKVVDKIGAGDTLFALTSLCFATNMEADLTMFVGNIAGAEAVGIMGNSRSISKIKFLKTINSILK